MKDRLDEHGHHLDQQGFATEKLLKAFKVKCECINQVDTFSYNLSIF